MPDNQLCVRMCAVRVFLETQRERRNEIEHEGQRRERSGRTALERETEREKERKKERKRSPPHPKNLGNPTSPRANHYSQA